MKKFLVVLLSLGLIVGISASASALDVKFSGSYQAVGAYENNMFQAGDSNGYFGANTSSAAVWQRLRIMPVFVVAEGLTLTTRIDALEKQWGNGVWYANTTDYTNSRKQNTTNQKLQENIEFERSYVTFATKAGVFDVGYMAYGLWGTDFNDWENTGARVKYTTKLGPVTLLGIWEKVYEGDYSRQISATTQNYVDIDNDAYALAGVYSGKGMEAGLLYKYTAANSGRISTNSKVKLNSLSPYMKATFGPVYVEAEVSYAFGKYPQFDSGTTPDVDAAQYGGYIKLRTNLGPAYFGASITYLQGDDLSDTAKKKGGLLNAKNVNPALIMLGDAYLTDVFPGGNANDTTMFSSKKNFSAGLMMSNVFGGFNPTPKLNIEASFTSAAFDKAPRVGQAKTGAEYASKNLGMELDVTATYKIYDNLSYMIGGGYLLTGDAFKGADSTKTVGNDYLLINRLALSF